MTNWTKMNKTKQNILETARRLFNDKGVSNVSIRMISRELEISHSNLIYHFNDKNILIEALHKQILEVALALNASLDKEKNTLKSLFYSIDRGFEIIYDYRFFMIDLNLIMRENPRLHSQFLDIEKLRFTMYKAKIDRLISEEILNSESKNKEYTSLIKQIRVLSDYWVASAQIYDATENAERIITSYSYLLKQLFFPYLTEKGKLLYAELIG